MLEDFLAEFRDGDDALLLENVHAPVLGKCDDQFGSRYGEQESGGVLDKETVAVQEVNGEWAERFSGGEDFELIGFHNLITIHHDWHLRKAKRPGLGGRGRCWLRQKSAALFLAFLGGAGAFLGIRCG